MYSSLINKPVFVNYLKDDLTTHITYYESMYGVDLSSIDIDLVSELILDKFMLREQKLPALGWQYTVDEISLIEVIIEVFSPIQRDLMDKKIIDVRVLHPREIAEWIYMPLKNTRFNNVLYKIKDNDEFLVHLDRYFLEKEMPDCDNKNKTKKL